MKKTLVVSFDRMSDINLQQLTRFVGDSLIDNEHMPDAGAYGKELIALSEDFTQAITDACWRDLHKISVKNDLRAIVIKKLRTVATYVMEIAQGHKTTLISSGFPLVSQKGGAPMLHQPRDSRILPGQNNGEILMQMKRTVGAKSYIYQYTSDPLTPDSKWQTIYSTRCKKLLTDLPLGVKLWFRMGVVGPYDQVVFSEVLFRHVA